MRDMLTFFQPFFFLVFCFIAYRVLTVFQVFGKIYSWIKLIIESSFFLLPLVIGTCFLWEKILCQICFKLLKSKPIFSTIKKIPEPVVRFISKVNFYSVKNPPHLSHPKPKEPLQKWKKNFYFAILKNIFLKYLWYLSNVIISYKCVI